MKFLLSSGIGKMAHKKFRLLYIQLIEEYFSFGIFDFINRNMEIKSNRK